jgi:hypothetical protein
MAIERGEFDAGNDWGATPAEAIAEAVAQEAPEPGETPSESPETEATAEAVEEVPTWADTDPKEEDAEAAPAAKTVTPAAAQVMEVKGAKGVHKFELRPDNEELTNTIKLGLGARQWQKERDDARKEATTAKKAADDAGQKAKVWDELQELTQLGQRDKVARAVLGEEGYQSLVKQIVRDVVEFSDADPERKLEIERERMKQDSDFKIWQSERKRTAAETALEARENAIEEKDLRSKMTSALQANSFAKTIKDRDVAQQRNAKLWKMSSSDLVEMADAGTEITPELINKVFAENAKFINPGQTTAKAEVAKTIEKKKVDAKKVAQVAATERHPVQTTALSQPIGNSAKALLRSLVRR